MRIIQLVVLLLLAPMAFSQSSVEPPLEEQFDVVMSDWLERSEYLKTYEGVNAYCQNPQFRKSVDRLLNEIHSYDSLIMRTMEDPTAYFSFDSKEEKKTLKDVHELESAYGLEAFVSHMREICTFRNDIESDAENLRKQVGIESYDGQVLLIETDMAKYLKKVDKLIVRVDEHLHVLHID